MPFNRRILILILFSTCINLSCKNKQKSINEIATGMARQAMVEKYPKIPHEELLNQIAGNKLYTELKERYTNSLGRLKMMTDSDGVKLCVVILTPEVGKSRTLANTYGIPYIAATCVQLGIDCVDLSDDINTIEPNTLTMVPFDKHWSKTGAFYISEQLAKTINGYSGARSGKTYTTRPATFGDLDATKGDVVEEEQKRTYKLRVNDQGLRMDHNLSFPKRKQTILFLGDDWLYCPYLDNEFTITNMLQKKFPDKEILNAANFNYTVEDYASLYAEKARYAEPDVVIVCTNGDDIIETYFSQRNRYSRAHRSYRPTEQETIIYDQLFK
jgi:hypothetical protein